MSDPIVLTTLNARYMHCAFGLRYLYANLGKLQAQARLCEFTIQQRAIDIVEQLLEGRPVDYRLQRLHLECDADERSHRPAKTGFSANADNRGWPRSQLRGRLARACRTGGLHR